LLRCRRRARGGGVRLRRLVYRSPRRLVVRRLREMAMSAAVAAEGVVVRRRVDRARASRGTSQLRALIHGRRSSGCVPDRYFFIDDFIPAFASGVLCGSLQSILAMGLLQIWGGHDGFLDDGGWRIDGGGRRRWKLRVIWGFTWSRDFNVIYTFASAPRVRWVGQLFLYPLCTCLYSYASLYVFLIQ
jgi:hypothetical protein